MTTFPKTTCPRVLANPMPAAVDLERAADAFHIFLEAKYESSPAARAVVDKVITDYPSSEEDQILEEIPNAVLRRKPQIRQAEQTLPQSVPPSRVGV